MVEDDHQGAMDGQQPGDGSRGGASITKKKKKTFINRNMKFEGRCDDLKGYVYDYTDARNAADTYVQTTKEVAEYVGRTYKMGAETRVAIERLRVPALPEPAAPPVGAAPTQQRLWEERCREHVKKEGILEGSLKSAYSLVYGQCAEVIRQKLRARADYDAMSTRGDVLLLLRNIKAI